MTTTIYTLMKNTLQFECNNKGFKERIKDENLVLKHQQRVYTRASAPQFDIAAILVSTY